MRPSRDTIRVLRRLQAVIRDPDSPEARHGRTGRVPDDLATPEFPYLSLTRDETDLCEQALAALVDDVRFEYLNSRSIKDLVWRFACQAAIDKSTNHVTAFIRDNAREPVDFDVFLTLLHLDVREEFEFGGVAFLPTSSSCVPLPDDLAKEPHVGGIVRVTAAGTGGRQVAERARATAEHALRMLRNGLRSEVHEAPNRQLRFTLGERYAFSGSQIAGWQLADDAAWDLSVDAAMAAQADSLAVSRLEVDDRTTVGSHALTALTWADRSLLTPDPLIRVLYLFFALEALVGDRSDGEKGTRISFRRAMLDHATSGGFRNPHITYALYGQVRSAAVHGGEAPVVTDKDANRMDSDVRAALGQLLEFSALMTEPRHSKVMDALDRHRDAPELVHWLQTTDDGTIWQDFTPVDR
jgi:hypothetical protein